MVVPAVRVTSLSKNFGRHRALDQVSFSARPGRVHGLLGPNGAGKTTVLRILLGLIRPDRGTVEVDGVILPAEVPRGRAGIAGFVESPHFYPYLTASRNLELLAAWDGRAAHRRVEELLERVGLADRAQHKVRGFSTGLRQRLGWAATLIGDPRVLVVDEPTTGLDPAGIQDLHALLAELAEQGRAVLLSSHDLAEVELLCTDVTILRAGAVVYDGSLAALTAKAPLRTWRLHTADDRAAAVVARRQARFSVHADPGHLTVGGTPDEMDALVLALGADGIAVRELTGGTLPLDVLFRQLTGAP